MTLLAAYKKVRVPNLLKLIDVACSARASLPQAPVVKTVGFPTAVGHCCAQAFLFIPFLPSIPASYRYCPLSELPSPCATVS